jgi:hypothetical protein
VEVIVLEDAEQAVDVKPGDGQRALNDMCEHGVQLLSVERALD